MIDNRSGYERRHFLERRVYNDPNYKEPERRITVDRRLEDDRRDSR